MPIADSQVFIALFLALATGIFAVRLGVALYKQKFTIKSFRQKFILIPK